MTGVHPLKKNPNPKRAKVKLAKKIIVTEARATREAHDDIATRNQQAGAGDKNHNRFELDFTDVAEHNLINIDDIKEFLLECIGKWKKSRGLVTFEQQETKLFVICHRSVAKRSLKLYIKKYLKKKKLRDWVHVVANKPESYQFKYISITA